jgi:hypothetical protein
MPVTKCPKCRCDSELLLNLVCCASPRCQNFDKKFFGRWLKGCGRTYPAVSSDWKFLGPYDKRIQPNKTVQSRVFDLYTHGPDTFAVYGGEDSIAVGKSDGSPVGFYQIFWTGPEDIDSDSADALLEAAARASA